MPPPTPYEVIVVGPSSSPEDSLRGLIQVVCDAMASHLTCALDILSKEYGHSREEMADVLKNSPVFAEKIKEDLGLLRRVQTDSGRPVNLLKPIPKVVVSEPPPTKPQPSPKS